MTDEKAGHLLMLRSQRTTSAVSQDSFDEQFYQHHYADVGMTGLDPLVHYERYGRLFGRAPNAFQQAKAEASEAAMMDPALLDIQYAQGWARSPETLRRPERVSVIVPSYNNGQWLARAIHSALSQEGVDAEVLVIDDGSTDDSVAVASGIAASAPTVRVISLLRNFGCYYARNIGLMHATGDYITILDSDDIMSPRRILRQLEALATSPGALGCLARARRWTDDFRTPISDLRHAENTLLWRRDAVKKVGAYDTVRFGGDTEFRERLQAAFGDEAVMRIPDELYFLRTLASSLTCAPSESGAYLLEGGKLTLSLSPERQAYSDNFSAWHREIRSSGKSKQRVEFPLKSRPFALGSPRQNASPSLGQRCVGAMASFPARRDSLAATVESILPQLDELILYLNNYDEIPPFARHPKIRATLGVATHGDLRDNGKFFDLPVDDNSYVFTLDDDIIYPADYAAQCIHHIEALDRSCIVGYHGVIFPQDNFDNLQQRTVHHFAHAYSGGFVDLLGTGALAWHSSALKLSLNDIGPPGLCDLWFALAGAKQGIPFYCAPRSKGWLQVYAAFDDCLFHETRARPERYFAIYDRYLGPALDGGSLRRHMDARFATHTTIGRER